MLQGKCYVAAKRQCVIQYRWLKLILLICFPVKMWCRPKEYGVSLSAAIWHLRYRNTAFALHKEHVIHSVVNS